MTLRVDVVAGPWRECPAVGCDVEVDGVFACDRHWRMLPRFTQRRLTDAMRLGWAPLGGKARDWSWWSQRAAREINAALANRERQLAEQAVAS